MRRLLRAHWLLAVFLLLGTILRVLATIAYRPAIVYTDSQHYLENMTELKPDQLNPIGYEFVLNPLMKLGGGLTLVVVVQHVVGLLLGVAIYALARRLTVYRWLAAVAAAPLLLDAYQVQIEQNIMAETTFAVLLVAILWLLLAHGVPGWRRAAVAGLLLGAAFAVRTIGITLLVPVVLYLLIAGNAWRKNRLRLVRRTAAAAAGFAVVFSAYAVYFHAETGRWGFTGAENQVLYGRTAVVADCSKLPLNEGTRLFCPKEPLGHRLGVDSYAHNHYGDPNWPGPLPPGTTKQALATEFARLVIRHQPLDVTWAALKDFAKGFAPTRTSSADDVPLSRWQFQLTYPNLQDPNTAKVVEKYDGSEPRVAHVPAAILRAYQLNGGYTSGSLLGLAALIGLAAAAGFGRARTSGLRAAALLPAAAGVILLLGSAAFEFSWRYQLPGLVFFPLAGAIGLRALLGKDQARPAMADFPDHVDSLALKDFGKPSFAPIVVVIAAYNEAAGIGAVLTNMPRTCAGLPVDVLVVVDGATDDTADVARRHGAFVCVAPSNRGQGAALRLGYHLAAEGGAEYVVTTDADGQYDNDELETLLEPILLDRADFVTGSRRLGAEDADSRLRWVGVRVFAVLASILTRRQLTDTSFGFRAMRAELATAVTLREPQYQSSELLLGALAIGARVVELPMTMRRRGDGTSKKGPGLVYGANYGRVMTTTWLREFVLRRGRRPERQAWRTRTGRTVRTSG
ncbi:dolichyl-phosphate-mannose-protein mannosyltransferase [Kribbella antiqua]|uniref:Dolichyl-phosphate-mannose-protein mannosyltransferase n=1 Tax=Kribbella antiqua TaxID=2512217 RepID=A0A4R2IQH2_9ACTN|nr:glycosyltransferase family 2 protein [Kribbella antiqua]TCO46279.1 dolichyl-phosphate-mannose-protein mannosyltransferase [Kribbella antiqua]